MATPNTLEKPKVRERIISLVLAGNSDAQVALAIQTPRRKVTRQAITEFRKRHADVLQPAIAEAERQATDYAIAQKVNRIANKDMLRSLLEEVRKARANGKSGEETGLVVRTYKQVGSGKDAQLVEEFKIDDGLLSAIERLESSAATELGQLPRPDQNVNLRAQVLIREYVGLDPSRVG